MKKADEMSSAFFVFLRCHIVQFQRTTNKLNGKIIVRKAEA
ncbi:hypothetical protein SEETMRM10607_17255 [Salmonella enterica subsp. enterica serovar Typhimurium]|nr:hypothetical protein SEETMRM10607_17255 [Salmonella enterica subsp. enterica serovar Typhimurium]